MPLSFRTLGAERGWINEALKGVFLSALCEVVKDELVSREDPTNLDQLITPCHPGRQLAPRALQGANPPTTINVRSPFRQLRPGPQLRGPFYSRCGPSSPSEPEPTKSGRLSPGERERCTPAFMVVNLDTLCPAVLLAWETSGLDSRPRAPDKLCPQPLGFTSLLDAALLWQDQTLPLTIILEFYQSGGDDRTRDRDGAA